MTAFGDATLELARWAKSRDDRHRMPNAHLTLCYSLGHQKIPEGIRILFRPIFPDIYIIYVGEICPRTALDGERESVAAKEDGGR